MASDTNETIELPAVRLPPAVATSTKSTKQNGLETLPQALLEPVQQRSKFRTFTVMIALFVSDYFIY